MKEKIFIFDLDDTLSESKTPITGEMAEVITELLKRTKMAVISGCLFAQFKKQVVAFLPQDENILKNLYIFPTNGSSMYHFEKGDWKEVYSEKFSAEERQKIIDVIEKVIGESGIDLGESYGPRIEDRESQVTFSALGQQAPVEKKKVWDPDQQIRLPLGKKMQELLPEFEVKIGGATSIDITRKGMTKAFAIEKIVEHLGITKDEMLFFGDAIFPGGNDYSVKEAGVPSIKVKNHHDTLIHLKERLELK